MGAKLPITDEYIISMGVTNFSGMGDFGNRSKVGQDDQVVLSDASTLCFGFEMMKFQSRSNAIQTTHMEIQIKYIIQKKQY